MSSRPLDLDQVVRELTGLVPGWAERGITAGQLTWRDAQAAWPQPIVTDRNTVADPESAGMTLTAANGNEALLVIWRGGWADVDLPPGTHVALMAQDQDLRVLGTVRAGEQGKRAEHPEHRQVGKA